MFNKYLQTFTNDIEDPKKLTHLAFRGKGKYNVPDEKYDEFYKKYYNALINDEAMYLIEKINDSTKFAFFLDIEIPKKSKKIDPFVYKKVAKFSSRKKSPRKIQKKVAKKFENF